MELPNNPLQVIRCIHPLVHVPLPLLTHPLTECRGGGLEVVVWHFCEEEVVHHVTIHHVTAEPIDSLAVILIDSLERAPLKLECEGVVGVKPLVRQVLLEGAGHDEPE